MRQLIIGILTVAVVVLALALSFYYLAPKQSPAPATVPAVAK